MAAITTRSGGTPITSSPSSAGPPPSKSRQQRSRVTEAAGPAAASAAPPPRSRRTTSAGVRPPEWSSVLVDPEPLHRGVPPGHDANPVVRRRRRRRGRSSSGRSVMARPGDASRAQGRRRRQSRQRDKRAAVAPSAHPAGRARSPTAAPHLARRGPAISGPSEARGSNRTQRSSIELPRAVGRHPADHRCRSASASRSRPRRARAGSAPPVRRSPRISAISPRVEPAAVAQPDDLAVALASPATAASSRATSSSHSSRSSGDGASERRSRRHAERHLAAAALAAQLIAERVPGDPEQPGLRRCRASGRSAPRPRDRAEEDVGSQVFGLVGRGQVKPEVAVDARGRAPRTTPGMRSGASRPRADRAGRSVGRGHIPLIYDGAPRTSHRGARRAGLGPPGCGHPKAGSPVIACPTMSECMSCVPS